MSGIFLSYSRADRPVAQIVAEALKAEGFIVWWDKVLKAGETYDEVTENMLRESSVVVVLWSHTSVKSKWVRAEATLGQRNAVVVPAMIEDAERPIMFELTQSANLIGWQGDRADPNWQSFVADIRGVIQPGETEVPANAPAAGEPMDATIENTFWTSIQDTSDPSEFEAYLKRYPQGHFSELARSRLSALTAPAEPAPVAAPAIPTQAPPQAVGEPGRAGSKIPLLVGGLLVLGAAIFGVMQLLPTRESTDIAEEAPEVAAPVDTCSVCPALTAVPAGTFTIGSPDNEPGRIGNEGPQKSITLSGFEMSTTEITGADWAACVDDGACAAKRGDAAAPVASVSWAEADTYARWLSGKSGRAFRLPSEAEWEYAARAGTETAYWWGEQFSQGQTASGSAAQADAWPANSFGLIGMLGNVREWTQDCYVNNYLNLPADGSALQSGNCQLRVVRGGSFKHGAGEHRAANRARNEIDTRDPALGFRVVVSQASGE